MSITAVVAALLGDLPWGIATLVAALGALGLTLRHWRENWEVPLHAATLGGLGIVLWWTHSGGWWVAVAAVGALAVTFWVALRRQQRLLAEVQSRNETVAAQLDRRISELFSLQELSYVLSESLQFERVVEQVVRYAVRFLQSEGAIVVIADDDRGSALRVAAAVGSLEGLKGWVTDGGTDGSLVRLAIDRERIEVAQGVQQGPAALLAGVPVRSAAVVPLRAQGVMMGALAVADRQNGSYTTEDLWLLSTVATQTSVVLANSRLYEMVRRSKEEWETTFNALAEGIAVVDRSGAILRANRALAAMADTSEGDLVGCDFSEMLFGESRAAQALIEATYRGERTAPVVTRTEVSRRVLRLTAAPLAGDARGSVVILVEDVTEQRALEAQLIQSDKMASIGQLVSGVAHELNNPLASIAGLSELLLERDSLPDPSREHLRVIHDQAERAGRIVGNLLTFAHKGTPEERTPVDLNDVVSRTSLLIAYELDLRGIELETALDPAPVVVMGDRYELQQVLLNLVTNAVQAVSDLPPGQPRRVRLLTRREEESAVLLVTDTGPGVPPHLVSCLFTPFFTTKTPGRGTGLGLSLSYGLVEAHGGQLRYASGSSGGAEFTVILPAHEARRTALVPTEPPPAQEGTPATAARRVLVVDDDAGVHRVVSALLAPDGCQVVGARGGEQALSVAMGERFDLVIADVGAAVSSAERFVPALLSARPDWAARILVTAAPGTPLDPATLPLRRIDKPFNLRELRAAATDILQPQPA